MRIEEADRICERIADLTEAVKTITAKDVADRITELTTTISSKSDKTSETTQYVSSAVVQMNPININVPSSSSCRIEIKSRRMYL